MNIDSFFDSFFIMVLQGARTVYSTLDSITFRDTSLLRYSITLLLLSVVIPMVITLTKSGVRTAKRSYRERSRERKEGSSDD